MGKEILIEVYDKDKVTKDDFMGRTSILISDIPKLSQGSWIPLKDCKNGEILLSGEIIPVTSEIPTVKEAEPKVVKEEGTPAAPIKQIEVATSPAEKDKKTLDGDKKAGVEVLKNVPADSDMKPSKMVGDIFKKDKLVFTLHSAKNLVNKDKLGESDPYAVINFGSQTQKTKTINNNLNPTWQHQVIFEVDDKSPSSININLFDDDYDKDEPIGNTTLSLKDIKKKGTIVNQSQKLSDCKAGEITFSSKYVDLSKETESKIPDSPTGIEVVTSEGKITTVKKTVDEFGNVLTEDVETVVMESGDDFNQFSKRIVQDIPEGMVVVTSESKVTSVKKTVDQFGNVISENVQTTVLKGGEELDNLSKPNDAQTSEKMSTLVPGVEVQDDMRVKLTVLQGRNLEKQKFGKPDPYVILTYGDKVNKSKSVQGNLNPEWDHEAIFDITRESPKYILLEVYDKDVVTRDDFMGRASIPITDISKLQGCWIPLKDCKSGEVFLSGDIIISSV